MAGDVLRRTPRCLRGLSVMSEMRVINREI